MIFRFQTLILPGFSTKLSTGEQTSFARMESTVICLICPSNSQEVQVSKLGCPLGNIGNLILKTDHFVSAWTSISITITSTFHYITLLKLANIPPWDKENHLQTYLYRGYASSQEGTMIITITVTITRVTS